jgi:hypothetical protein
MKTAYRALLAVGLVGCSSGAGLGEVPRAQGSAPIPLAALTANAQATAPGASVLGVLQVRDQRVTLLASRDGLRVTVRDAVGAVVAENATIEELREKDPFVYEICRSSVASIHDLDARLDHPERLQGRGLGGTPGER